MDILFIGQRGIPARRYALLTTASPTGPTEQRVEALAVHLARAGHRVAVMCLRQFTPRSLIRYNGVELVRGGFAYPLSCLLALWRRQPTVVHVSGWRMGLMLPLCRFLSPSSTFTWTLDTPPTRRPSFPVRRLIHRAADACAGITVPSRSSQYRLRRTCGVRATYIPDGYLPSRSHDVPLRQFGVRRGQYTLLLSGAATDLVWIADAYRATATRKKLVVLQPPGFYGRFSKRRYPFLHFVGTQEGAALSSLLGHAAVVVASDDVVSSDVVLQVMEAGRAVIAITHPLYESLFGSTARFVRRGDNGELTSVLATVVTDKRVQAAWGRAAKLRARAHFQWPRIAAEYLSLYRSGSAQRVSLDSVRRASLMQAAPQRAEI